MRLTQDNRRELLFTSSSLCRLPPVRLSALEIHFFLDSLVVSPEFLLVPGVGETPGVGTEVEVMH